jgi:Yip1-like protein
MAAQAESPVADERVWLLRAVLVLVSPRSVFAGLRDDSEAAARARAESVLALVLLAGIAGVLWTPTYGRLMNDKLIAWDGLLVAVVAFIGGGIYGAVVYWGSALLLDVAATVLGSARSYRQARHVIAFAAAPLALSLFLVWPVRVAVYGEDLFRSGGSDHGTGNWAFVGLELGFVVWALVLLAVGIRVVYRVYRTA